jgi:hypothetical protein
MMRRSFYPINATLTLGILFGTLFGMLRCVALIKATPTPAINRCYVQQLPGVWAIYCWFGI